MFGQHGVDKVMNAVHVTDLAEKLVREWLDYGKLRGLGQWRNSGKGRFEWKEV